MDIRRILAAVGALLAAFVVVAAVQSCNGSEPFQPRPSCPWQRSIEHRC